VELCADRTERLDVFLARMLPEHSRTKLHKLISAGEVTVDAVVRRPSFMLREGMLIELDEVPESEAQNLTPMAVDLDVVYEDEDCLIVNKPRGMATHPAPGAGLPTLVHALLARSHSLSEVGGAFRPGIVHRLDKETTGLLVVAKNDLAHQRLAAEIAEKRAERRYVALVEGTPELDRFQVEAPLGRDPRRRIAMAVVPQGKPALTQMKVLRRGVGGGRCLLACRLQTGRTHQIRVHCAAIGLPVVGDRVYAPQRLHDEALQLHAAYLRIRQPRTGVEIEAFATPPPDFIAREWVQLDALRNWSYDEGQGS